MQAQQAQRLAPVQQSVLQNQVVVFSKNYLLLARINIKRSIASRCGACVAGKPTHQRGQRGTIACYTKPEWR